MPVAGSTYWNMVHGLYGEEAPQDEEGIADHDESCQKHGVDVE